MANIATILSVILYGIAAALLYLHVQKTRQPLAEGQSNGMGTGAEWQRAFSQRPAFWVAFIAMLLHALAALEQSGLPATINLPFFAAMSFMALAIVIVQLIMCLYEPADYLGLVVYPVAAIAILSNLFVGGVEKSVSASLQLHIVLSVTAYALLALGALQAVLVFLQRRHLKQHRPRGFLHALPPLIRTESMLFSLLTFGFVLLTLSLLTGFMFLDDMFAQHLVHKTVLSCVAWAIFAVLLFGRWRFGWRGQAAVRWTLIGFTTLLVAYFGSKLVLELILQR